MAVVFLLPGACTGGEGSYCDSITVGYCRGGCSGSIDVKSVLDRVCIVTPEVPRENFRVLEKVGWKMVEVEQVHCNHKNHLDERDYDVASDSEGWPQLMEANLPKFHVWSR